MSKIKKLMTLTSMMALFAGQIQGQEYNNYPNITTDQCNTCDCNAVADCEQASYLSALLPIGAIVVAAVIIATTNRHHHHHSTSCGSTRSPQHSSSSSSSHHHFHSH